MSAYVVSSETVQLCVTALHSACAPKIWNPEEANELGRALFLLNEQAVNYRYPNRDQSTGTYSDWVWHPAMPLLDCYGMPINRRLACQWVKALRNLRYQLTEGEQFTSHRLYVMIDGKIRDIEESIVIGLPDYKDAAIN